jgi:hypothetical protein
MCAYVHGTPLIIGYVHFLKKTTDDLQFHMHAHYVVDLFRAELRVHGLMGIIRYLMYGDVLQSQVSLNLPSRKASSKVAIYTTLVNLLTKYARWWWRPSPRPSRMCSALRHRPPRASQDDSRRGHHHRRTLLK